MPGRKHCGLPGEALFRESMYFIKYGFGGSSQFSSLHILDSLIDLYKALLNSWHPVETALFQGNSKTQEVS